MREITVRFTAQLERFLEVPAVQVRASTPREALEAAFASNPRLRPYLLDEQQRLRQHVALFVQGALVRGAEALDTPFAAEVREIDVMQALSGG